MHAHDGLNGELYSAINQTEPFLTIGMCALLLVILYLGIAKGYFPHP